VRVHLITASLFIVAGIGDGCRGFAKASLLITGAFCIFCPSSAGASFTDCKPLSPALLQRGMLSPLYHASAEIELFASIILVRESNLIQALCRAFPSFIHAAPLH
jgi:hypothetical protein